MTNENIIEKEPESHAEKQLDEFIEHQGTPNINFPDESDFEDGYEKGYNQAFSDIDKFLEEK